MIIIASARECECTYRPSGSVEKFSLVAKGPNMPTGENSVYRTDGSTSTPKSKKRKYIQKTITDKTHDEAQQTLQSFQL